MQVCLLPCPTIIIIYLQGHLFCRGLELRSSFAQTQPGLQEALEKRCGIPCETPTPKRHASPESAPASESGVNTRRDLDSALMQQALQNGPDCEVGDSGEKAQPLLIERLNEKRDSDDET